MKKRLLAVLLTVSMLAAMLIVPAMAYDVANFTDVAEGDWFYEYVDWAADRDITNGTTASTYSPNDNLTRAQFVTMMARYTNIEQADYIDNDTAFTDLEDGFYYVYAVKWAEANEITNGTSATAFSPNNNITREQVCTIIYRFVKYYAELTNQEEIFVTDDKEDLTKPVELSDLDSVSPYATDAVEFCRLKGYILGYPDGEFKPQREITRAEIAAILYRLSFDITDDLLPLAVQAGVDDLNARIDKANSAAAEGDKYGLIGSVDEVKFNMDRDQKIYDIETYASASLSADFSEKLVATATYYALRILEADPSEDPAYTYDDVKDTIQAVADELGLDISEKSVRNLADQVWDEIKEEASEVWAEFLTGNFVSDPTQVYLMQTVEITGKYDLSYVIDTKNGAGTEVVGGKKAALKAMAKDIVKQYRDELREQSAGEIITKTEEPIEAVLNIKFTGLATETIQSYPNYTLTMKLDLDSNGYVGYKYADMDEIYVYVPKDDVLDLVDAVIDKFAADANEKLLDQLIEEYPTEESAKKGLLALQEDTTPDYLEELFSKHGIDIYEELSARGFSLKDGDGAIKDYVFAEVADWMNEQAGVSNDFSDDAAPALISSGKSVTLGRLAELATNKNVLDAVDGKAADYLKKAAKLFDLIPESAVITAPESGADIAASNLSDLQAACEAGDAAAAVEAFAALVKNSDISGMTVGELTEGVIINASYRGVSTNVRVYVQAK